MVDYIICETRVKKFNKGRHFGAVDSDPLILPLCALLYITMTLKSVATIVDFRYKRITIDNQYISFNSKC